MNADEAMKVAKRQVLGWYDDMHTAGPVLAAEVERLRAELAAAIAELEKLVTEKIKAASVCPEVAKTSKYREAIEDAIAYANGRESEWGSRAEDCFAILYRAIDDRIS